MLILTSPYHTACRCLGVNQDQEKPGQGESDRLDSEGGGKGEHKLSVARGS